MEQDVPPKRGATDRIKFIIGGVLIAAAIVYLIVSSTLSNSQYYVTVEELLARQTELTGRQVRVSGVVLGDTIQYDPQALVMTFTIANIPGGQKEIEELGGMAAVLHAAAYDGSLPRLQVVYHGVKPDLLTNEAQAILTGALDADGIFQAEELLLKCPTRYEEAQAGK